jgi:acyl-CoA synthetase (AMP-forming)/AMP-acid ligase II
MDHPGVDEAVVFGWPHKLFGEQPVTCVVTNSPVAELKLQEFCARRMEPYKVPKWFLSMPELPRNPAGKIAMAELREIFRRNMENRPPTP